MCISNVSRKISALKRNAYGEELEKLWPGDSYEIKKGRKELIKSNTKKSSAVVGKNAQRG